MCGIFGLITNDKSNLSNKQIKIIIRDLYILSESRGKEASGIAVISNNTIIIGKQPQTASRFITSTNYREITQNIQSPIVVIGQTRLATSGCLENNKNNQPVIKDGLVGVHNGIVVNVDKLWISHPELKPEYGVDTEIILALLNKFINKDNSISQATAKTFALIQGTASIAILINNSLNTLLATNNGSLYISRGDNDLIFASERYILEKLISTHFNTNRLYSITRLPANHGFLINHQSLESVTFSTSRPKSVPKKLDTLTTKNYKIIKKFQVTNQNRLNKYIPITDFTPYHKYNPDVVAIRKLRRCTRCILPETMPFIQFDKNGVCNYCHSYKKIETKGQKALEAAIAPYRRNDGQPEVLVALSGGRDSSYGLHYIKKVLKMNPVAYSYDWGMITDLGRRNQARMCGQLGVEHILVSADIRKKREYIKKNVLAWLKKPHLCTIPLFMAGDKHYLYYANKLMKQTGTKSIIMSENILERTHFKHGFCGIRHNATDKPSYFLSTGDKLKMMMFYGKEFLINPAYLNTSLLDVFTGYLSYYTIHHNYLYLYQYIPWDEEIINRTLVNEYGWETATDTKTTWRIGDGTAPLYNYIYYIIAGFSEHDTFRSNQIRERIISREKAMLLAEYDNQPRYESIRWYCDTINLDFDKTLQTIFNIPRLYEK